MQHNGREQRGSWASSFLDDASIWRMRNTVCSWHENMTFCPCALFLVFKYENLQIQNRENDSRWVQWPLTPQAPPTAAPQYLNTVPEHTLLSETDLLVPSVQLCVTGLKPAELPSSSKTFLKNWFLMQLLAETFVYYLFVFFIYFN